MGNRVDKDSDFHLIPLKEEVLLTTTSEGREKHACFSLCLKVFNTGI